MGSLLEKDSFKYYTVVDIDVYIPTRIKARNNKININYSKFLWISSLTIDGIIL